MNALGFFAAASIAAASKGESELVFIWNKATPEAKVIILCLVIF